jgi:hypothetical protein
MGYSHIKPNEATDAFNHLPSARSLWDAARLRRVAELHEENMSSMNRRADHGCRGGILPLVLLLLLASAPPAAGQINPSAEPPRRREMTATPLQIEERIQLDGIFDEPVWQRAQPATDFLQQDPAFGEPATEPTEVRIAFDRENLYMSVSCFDSEPDKLLGFQRRRDEFLSSDDRFMWVFDTYLDARGGYFFEINPSGLMGDSTLGSAGQSNRQWDGIWDAKIIHTDYGWAAEIKIPFRTFNFDPDAEAWGVNFQRTVRRKSEETLWTGHARNQGLRRMTNTGLLRGIREVSQGQGLDLKPYVLGTAFKNRNGNETVYQGKPGLDVFYSPTPRLRANFTINTDFAQTEVDDRQVNLTRFSLFFEEKREFFLEGAGFFDFRSTWEGNPDTRVFPFFSRRIGLNADREPQRIIYGTKLTGQVGSHDIGIMHVRTGEDRGSRGVDFAGDDFTVARVKRRILSQSFIGGLVTRRDSTGPNEASYTAGVDALLATDRFMGDHNLELNAFLLRTSIEESVRAEREGGRYSFGTDLNFPNDRWEGSVSFREVQRNFNPTVGFVSRRAFRRYNPAVTYSHRPNNNRWIRRFLFGANIDYTTDLSNELLTRQFELTPFELNTHAGDVVRVVVSPTYERLEEDFAIFRDPVNGQAVILPRGGEYDFTRLLLQMETANRRLLAVEGTVDLGNFLSGTRKTYSAQLTLRARPGVIFYSEVEWNRIDLEEGSFQTRIYRFTPELQFSPWVALVNNFQYDNESRVLGWQSRFRWILTPGTDFYFVYTQNWRDFGIREPGAGLHGFATQDRRASTKFIYTHRF